MRIIYGILLFIVFVVGIAFACLNATRVDIHYFIGTIHWPLSLLLGATFACGCFVGWLTQLLTLIRQKRQTHALNKKLQNVETELANLRTIPYRQDI